MVFINAAGRAQETSTWFFSDPAMVPGVLPTFKALMGDSLLTKSGAEHAREKRMILRSLSERQVAVNVSAMARAFSGFVDA